MRAAAVGASLLVVGALAACSADDGPSEHEAGALAAAEAYVDAIASLDVEAADAMTDPDALSNVPGSDSDVDIREALPDAVDAIEDPWVAIVGPTYDSRSGGQPEFSVAVSYTIRDLTGGGTIEIRLDEDGDPDEVDDWTVTAPLIVHAETYADESVPAARIGSVVIDHYSSSHRGVAGYPAGYRLEPAEPTVGVTSLWIAVGAADNAPWDDSLPMLERRGR